MQSGKTTCFQCYEMLVYIHSLHYEDCCYYLTAQPSSSYHIREFKVLSKYSFILRILFLIGNKEDPRGNSFEIYLTAITLRRNILVFSWQKSGMLMCYTAHKTLENSKETAIKKKMFFIFFPTCAMGLRKAHYKCSTLFFFLIKVAFDCDHKKPRDHLSGVLLCLQFCLLRI